MTTKKTQKTHRYNCEKCDFNTNNKNDYRRHTRTAKHQINNGLLKKTQNYSCEYCDKSFNDRSGLWRHNQKCNSNNIQDANDNEDKSEIHMLSNTIVELVKQNNEFKQLLIEQNQKMAEMVGSMGSNNTINSNNTMNNKFNITMFLNEKCKNAMSLTDFVKSINLTVQDFIETGENGFINGISNIIIKRINNMDLHDRPVHCTDLKRETVYVKDDHKWEKDANKEKLRKAVKRVAYKNDRMRSVWYNETPDVDVLGTENCEKFLKYSQSALGGCGKEETKLFEDKVIKNVLKEVTINKYS